eukprot:jgi/Chrpa1/4859/Chrysochromulina_OHIO_Genome00010227-RA
MAAGHLGYRGGKAALNAAWLELDGDESGAVTFDELDSWVFGRSFGRQKRMEVVHTLSLRHRVRLEDEPWSEARLRDELRHVIREADLRPTDLPEAWDKSGDGSLGKREWLVRFKCLFGGAGELGGSDSEGVALWYEKVRCAVDEAFETLAALHMSQPKQVSIGDMAKWLTRPEARRKEKEKDLPSFNFSAMASASSEVSRELSPRATRRPSYEVTPRLGRDSPAPSVSSAGLSAGGGGSTPLATARSASPVGMGPSGPGNMTDRPPTGTSAEPVAPKPDWRPCGGKGRPVWPLEVNTVLLTSRQQQSRRRVLANLAAKGARVPAAPTREDNYYLRFNKKGPRGSDTERDNESGAGAADGFFFLSRRLNWPHNGIAYRRVAPQLRGFQTPGASTEPIAPAITSPRRPPPAPQSAIGSTRAMDAASGGGRSALALRPASAGRGRSTAERLEVLSRGGPDEMLQVAWPVRWGQGGDRLAPAVHSPRKGLKEKGAPLR